VTDAPSVLDLDPGLAAVLPEGDRPAARAASPVCARPLAPGEWDAFAEYGGREDWLGLLLAAGFLSRSIECVGETVSEILGPSDLLRPWDQDGDYPVPGIDTKWRVLEPATIAVLDGEFAARIAPWPPLTAALLARIGRRARWSALRLLVSQIPGIEIRVLYLLWHFAERWGEPRDGRMLIPVRLTHQQIGEVIGAQRPSVSHAVSRLREEGVAQLPGEGWEIPADAPQAIDRLLGHAFAAPV